MYEIDRLIFLSYKINTQIQNTPNNQIRDRKSYMFFGTSYNYIVYFLMDFIPHKIYTNFVFLLIHTGKYIQNQ